MTPRTRLAPWQVVVSGLLAAATAVAVAGGLVSWWVHHTVVDTDAFMEVVTPVATSPATTERIADLASTRLLAELAVEERVATALGGLDDLLTDTLGGLGAGLGGLLSPGNDAGSTPGLADGLVDGIEAGVDRAIRRAVATPAFRSALLAQLRDSHTALVALLRAGPDPGSVVGTTSRGAATVTDDGDLVVDLQPLVRTAADQVAADLGGLPGVVADQVVAGLDIPTDATRLVLVRADQVAPYRARLVVLDRGMWWFVGLAVVLAIASVAVVGRWWAVAVVGAAVSVGAMAARPLVTRATAEIAAGVTDPAGRATTETVLAALVAPLESLAADTLVAGVVLAATGLVVAMFLRARTTPSDRDTPHLDPDLDAGHDPSLATKARR